RDQDPPPFGMVEYPLDRAGELRLRGRHVVLAELGHEERRHRLELGLGGETHVYGVFRHESLDAGCRRLVSTLDQVVVPVETERRRAPRAQAELPGDIVG